MPDIFLLTKTQNSSRTGICLNLIERSKNSKLYLAGDGVYNLLSNSIKIPPEVTIFVCKEDLDARGLKISNKAIVLEDFYEKLAEEVMEESNKVYSF
ncbi:MAG: hypothetical protein MUO26_16095 [Methanotrichaceae archaeon]|nr:hypothetical protein [Methanotrichaceae archaeon]